MLDGKLRYKVSNCCVVFGMELLNLELGGWSQGLKLVDGVYCNVTGSICMILYSIVRSKDYVFES